MTSRYGPGWWSSAESGAVAAVHGRPRGRPTGSRRVSVRHVHGQHHRRGATRASSALTLSHHASLLAGTAFFGAYTTFSTWMLETQRLAEERQIWPAVANIVVSVVLGVAAALAGQWIAGLL